MTPRSFKLAFAHFPYGGNGGTSSEVPYVRHWKERILPWMIQDPRISGWVSKDFSDTPIPMTRNASVLWARKQQADFLIMVDSDMWPDRYLGQPGVQPFLESSFERAYTLWDARQLCIVSPYVGPPPEELPYTFEWRVLDGADSLMKLEMHTREYVARLGGFHEIAAGPTGLIMIDMRLFELTDPKLVRQRLEDLGRDSELYHKGWFYYEYPDEYGAEKASTEDVTFTRELSQVGLSQLGYNPVIGNYDAWSAHMKPKACGKPLLLGPEHINERLTAAVLTGPPRDKKLIHIDYTAGMDFSGAEVVVIDEDNPVRPKLAPDICDRTISGYEVKSLGFQTSLADLTTLGSLFRDTLIEHRKKSLHKMLAVEVGSWVGESAVAMVCGATGVNTPFELWAVDPHVPFNDGDRTWDLYGDMPEGLVEQTFAENTRRFPEIVHKKTTSADAAMWSMNKKVSFLFLDGAHDREGLELDLRSWLPRMSKRGKIVFHDYKFPGYPDVARVVHEWFGEARVYHPPGTNLAVVDVASFVRDVLKMKGKGKDCGPASGAKSPPKGGPAQKVSAVKGGPVKKGK